NVGIGAPDEQLFSVLECDAAAIGAIGPVLGLVALHRDFRPDLEGTLCEPSPEHDVRAPALHHPVRHRAVRIRNVNVDPGVWVDPFHPGYLSNKLYRLVLVKLCLERMMSDRGGDCDEK